MNQTWSRERYCTEFNCNLVTSYALLNDEEGVILLEIRCNKSKHSHNHRYFGQLFIINSGEEIKRLMLVVKDVTGVYSLLIPVN